MPANSPADLHRLFEDAFNAGDVDALASLYEPDATLLISGREIVGRKAIHAAYRGLVGRGRMRLQTAATVTTGIGLAVLHGAWVIEPEPVPSDKTRTEGLSTEVARQQADGTWLFVIDSPNTPTASGA